jgi:biopolymer transport protein ExbD
MHFRKRRSTSGETKPEIQMTPMLDMIFQLLVFFILTFRPVMDEGQFDVTMSASRSGTVAAPSDAPALSESIEQVPIQVVLKASGDGRLAAGGITMGDRVLQNMATLRAELNSIVEGDAENFSVVIEADSGLQYQYVMQAVNTISHAGIRNISFSIATPGG